MSLTTLESDKGADNAADTPATKPARRKKRAAYKPVDALEVRIWGQRAGAVALDPNSNHYAFSYDPKFISRGLELAPLQMRLRTPGPFVFPNLPEATYYRLPALLADALPDRFGNALIDAWMAENAVSAQQVTPLDRLAYMSTRGMGALSFAPSRGPARAKSFAVEMVSLVEAARKSVQGELHNDDLAEAALKQIIQLGTSAGGARAKAVVAWNPKTKEIRSGQFDIDPGFEAWLLKFDGIRTKFKDLGPTETYGRIEYAYHLMAKEAGIDMSECRLLEENGRAHFMTKRFDRGEGNQRHHMQTLCAMAHLDYNQVGTHSYDQMFSALEELELGRSALQQALRRMIFNVRAANNDDHTKNFSFLLREGSTKWELAPGYDITYAYEPGNKWIARHLMSVNGKFERIEVDDMRAVADRYGLVGDFKDTLERVESAVQRWPEFADAAGVAKDQVERVTKGMADAWV